MHSAAESFLRAASANGHDLFRVGAWIRCGRCRRRVRVQALRTWAHRQCDGSRTRQSVATHGPAALRGGRTKVTDDLEAEPVQPAVRRRQLKRQFAELRRRAAKDACAARAADQSVAAAMSSSIGLELPVLDTLPPSAWTTATAPWSAAATSAASPAGPSAAMRPADWRCPAEAGTRVGGAVAYGGWPGECSRGPPWPGRAARSSRAPTSSSRGPRPAGRFAWHAPLRLGRQLRALSVGHGLWQPDCRLGLCARLRRCLRAATGPRLGARWATRATAPLEGPRPAPALRRTAV